MQPADDWALDYISITYIQQIMEAFDDDGSGYITVSEVNKFTDAIPTGVDWTYVSPSRGIDLPNSLCLPRRF